MRRTRHLLAPRLGALLTARFLSWTVVLAVALAVGLVVVSGASAHRLISGDYAQRSANSKVYYTICGGGGWVCGGVFVPIYQCGYHSWCWSGTSHKEVFWFLTRLRASNGAVNGHTGSVTVYNEW